MLCKDQLPIPVHVLFLPDFIRLIHEDSSCNTPIKIDHSIKDTTAVLQVTTSGVWVNWVCLAPYMVHLHLTVDLHRMVGLIFRRCTCQRKTATSWTGPVCNGKVAEVYLGEVFKGQLLGR